jgi:hypothetical protein
LASPLTVQVSAPVLQVFVPGLLVTVYPVIVLPPVEGAVQATTASLFPAVAFGALGFDGTVAGMTELEGVEAGLVPTALWATTLKV